MIIKFFSPINFLKMKNHRSKNIIRNSLYKPELYTDASIKKNIMGIGIWSEYYNISKSFQLKGLSDINRGELGAIFIAMLYQKNKEIIILTDSQTSLDLIKGKITCKEKYDIINDSILFLLNNWEKNNIKFLKVKAHSKNIGNDNADNLAAIGTMNDIQTFILPDDVINPIDYNNKDIADIVYTIEKLNRVGEKNL